MHHGDSEDFRKFVGVAGADRRFDRRVPPGARLDHDRDFLRSFDFAAPVIE